MSTVITDVRCPVGTSALLMRLLSESGSMVDLGDHKMQLHCKECSRDFRRINEKIQRVLHIYTVGGDFLMTQIQFKDGDEKSIDVETQLKIIRLSTQFTKNIL